MPDSQTSVRGARRFVTTRWTMVLAAGRRSSPDSQKALAVLCETYWYPLYAFIRRTGQAPHDAQDLTQEFFAQLLEKDSLRVADRERGKFRSFLLASLNHFLLNERRKANTQKRGGGLVHVSLDFESGEHRYCLEPSHDLTPEKIFEQRWALTVFDRAMARLQAEFVEAKKQREFDRLKNCLAGAKDSVPYQQIAADLGMSEGAVKVAVHRLRRRCRELLLAEISETVESKKEVEEELRYLFEVLSG